MTAKPPWLRVRYAWSPSSAHIAGLIAKSGLHSVCQSARCPNRHECWAGGTATFMIMGEHCTRACRFCAVKTMAKPPPLDREEPGKLAEAVGSLGLRYVVLTSVTRDDLSDGGASHFAQCVRKLKGLGLAVEALVPDFGGSRDSISLLLDAGPDVVSHNIETVQRLTPRVRDRRAGYLKSLEVLKLVRELSGGRTISKSGMMVGLGESKDEVGQALTDLRGAGVGMVTIGQYLRPTDGPRHISVARYVRPDEFSDYGRMARSLGFIGVASGPLVRSSYKAAEMFFSARER